MRLARTLSVACACAVAAAVSRAQVPDAQDPWAGSLGLAYVSTSGNSETSNLGLDLALKRKPTPWGLDVAAGLARAENSGVKTAERSFARGRAERSLSARWSLFGGGAAEKDKFAGFDLRFTVETGAKYSALAGPVHELSLDGGLTWTREDPVGFASYDHFGALLGLAYAWKFSGTAILTERILWYPNFDKASDWRLTSETAVQAALSTRLALKAAYSFRFDNQPVPGFEDTDTATTLSLILGL